MSSRNRFSKQEIARYWGGDSRISWAAADCCWHCGRPTTSVQRAHITPLCEGGEDSISNIHLLCLNCHQDSEYLSGEVYWTWLATDQCNPVQWVYRNLALLEAKGIIDSQQRAVLEGVPQTERVL